MSDPTPLSTGQKSGAPDEPLAKPPCDRVLVGRGTDTYYPHCVLPSGHAGACSPTPVACKWCGNLKATDGCPLCEEPSRGSLDRTRDKFVEVLALWNSWERRGRAAEQERDRLRADAAKLRELLGVRS